MDRDQKCSAVIIPRQNAWYRLKSYLVKLQGSNTTKIRLIFSTVGFKEYFNWMLPLKYWNVNKTIQMPRKAGHDIQMVSNFWHQQHFGFAILHTILYILQCRQDLICCEVREIITAQHIVQAKHSATTLVAFSTLGEKISSTIIQCGGIFQVIQLLMRPEIGLQKYSQKNILQCRAAVIHYGLAKEPYKLFSVQEMFHKYHPSWSIDRH